MTRHDDALHQIAHYRRRLGATPRALPHKFVNEQILAKRYDLGHSDLDQFPAEAENDGIADETIEAQAPVTPAGAPQARPPAHARSDKAAEASPSLAHKPAQDPAALTSADEPVQAAPPIVVAGQAAAAPALTDVDEAAHALAALDERWRPPSATTSCKSAATEVVEALVARYCEAIPAAEATTTAGRPL